jgi:hypothetical protein
MKVEVYEGLDVKEKAFADLLVEISKQLKRLADLMDRELGE